MNSSRKETTEESDLKHVTAVQRTCDCDKHNFQTRKRSLLRHHDAVMLPRPATKEDYVTFLSDIAKKVSHFLKLDVFFSHHFDALINHAKLPNLCASSHAKIGKGGGVVLLAWEMLT